MAMPPGLEQASAAERLGFLLARHGQIMNLRLRHALGVSGLGPRHGSTLLRLARLGATSQQHLIEALAVDPSAVVAILNDLERDGLVVRSRDPADRRRHIVEITKTGRKAANEVENAISEVEREIFTHLDDAEVTQLHALLSRLHIQPSDGVCGD
jgi:DNA-binding MarR family transcriptional regulator